MSKVNICDQILLEQFLLDLDENTQRWVRCHHPESLVEALRLEENFDSAQGENGCEWTLKGKLNISQ